MEPQYLWCMTGDFGDMHLADTWCHVVEESKCVVEGQTHTDPCVQSSHYHSIGEKKHSALFVFFKPITQV